MAWATQGRQTSPAAGSVLADTGPLGGQGYYPQVLVSSTVGTGAVLEVLGANGAVQKSQVLAVPANGTFEFTSRGDIEVVEGGRLRVTSFAAITGTIQASLFW